MAWIDAWVQYWIDPFIDWYRGPMVGRQGRKVSQENTSGTKQEGRLQLSKWSIFYITSSSWQSNCSMWNISQPWAALPQYIDRKGSGRPHVLIEDMQCVARFSFNALGIQYLGTRLWKIRAWQHMGLCLLRFKWMYELIISLLWCPILTISCSL